MHKNIVFTIKYYTHTVTLYNIKNNQYLNSCVYTLHQLFLKVISCEMSLYSHLAFSNFKLNVIKYKIIKQNNKTHTHPLNRYLIIYKHSHVI